MSEVFGTKAQDGASGGRRGKGEESNDQHAGKVWRFEAVEGNGGIGVDSSEESLGMKDIDGNGAGGADEVEDSIPLGNCKGTVGTEDRRVVVVEDCGTRGNLKVAAMPANRTCKYLRERFVIHVACIGVCISKCVHCRLSMKSGQVPYIRIDGKIEIRFL